MREVFVVESCWSHQDVRKVDVGKRTARVVQSVSSLGHPDCTYVSDIQHVNSAFFALCLIWDK